MSKWETLSELYIKNKLKIIPIQPNSKLPAIPLWNKDCSCEPLQILYWYESDHNMNFALPCKENNLFVLDLDKHNINNDGVENFKKLCNELGIDLPNTLIQETPSLGQHYIFKSDDELKQVNGVANAFKNYGGIDIRNSNYIVIAPSEINGKHYHFINNVTPTEMPIQLKEYILKNVGTKQENTRKPYEKPKEVFKGDRDNQLFQYINQLYFKTRLDYDEILLLANHFNETVFDTPLPKKNIKYKVEKAFDKDRGTCLFLKVGGENEEE